jgi:hypothetical protein
MAMKVNWKYFLLATTIAALALLKYGAPPMAVAAGIALACVLTLRRSRVV